MIVCLCRGVTDRDVRAAHARGADTVDAAAALTGAGTACGCCRGAVASILADSCGAAPCAACPNRASEGVPQRVAATPVKSP
jgi:bacterioferritin-associated ferredoxin